MKLLLLLGLVALSTALVSPPPNVCRVQVQQIDRSTPLNQVLIKISVLPSCPLDGKAVIRFRTAGGGILPPVGYVILRGSYPRELTPYWLRRGGVVEQKINGQFLSVWRISE